MEDIKKIYGKYVFDDKVMKKYLSKEIYNSFKKATSEGKDLPHNIAKAISSAMCKWAIENGATHYTHWFQPLTNATAEKRECFISFDNKNNLMLKLSGRELIKGESDASSFPSGGLRATFEARGYTVWDTSSPAFIKKENDTTTLYIPTAFYSYTGEALDKKTLLLRSIDTINKETIKLLNLFGKKVNKIIPMLGPEQEYFLIDREKYLKRKDLIYTGRTLFGSLPPKGQEMDDHYYGTITKKFSTFMNDVNKKLWELGVPAKTYHNEVAPQQYELAVIYDEANISCDHNQLVMDILKSVANDHNLVCLLHEKPFDKLNGSGKHVNWSIVTDKNENLLSPGDNPQENLQFLLLVSLILKAVDENADILRSSASNVGNDRRLGGNEAPPTIISVFLGEHLTNIFENIENKNSSINKKTLIATGINAVPDLYKDVTDRNRTSPFAFTGNKFEFRMVGSSDSCAMPVTVINTIVAKSFKEANEYFKNIKTTNKKDLNKEIINYIKKIYNEHKKIVFNGNGYSEEWIKEAKNRKLPIIKDMVSAIKVLDTKKANELFTSMGVMSDTELKSRISVEYETYIKATTIELKATINIIKKQILPSCVKYEKKLSDTINSLTLVSNKIDTTTELNLLKEINFNIQNLKTYTDKLNEQLEKCDEIESLEKKANYINDNLVPLMNKARNSADILEMLVDKSYWPMPSYGDLIF